MHGRRVVDELRLETASVRLGASRAPDIRGGLCSGLAHAVEALRVSLATDWAPTDRVRQSSSLSRFQVKLGPDEPGVEFEA